MWKKKKSESKLPSKINYRFIEVDGECTIIIGKNTYLKSKKKLQELEVYDLIIKGKIEGEKLEAIFLKDQVVKKDDIAKELADKAKENLEYKDGKYYRPPFHLMEFYSLYCIKNI